MKLGKGLQSLIPPKQRATEVDYPQISQPLRDRRESVFDIDVDKIKANPYQPRHEMESIALQDLARSIKQHGILQPIIVTKSVKDTGRGQGIEYQLIAGHRRLEAAKMAGLPHIPAIVRDSTDQQRLELALVENIQRQDLNPIDRALAFKQLYEEFNLSHDEIGEKVGKSREYVSNSMRLLGLPEIVQQTLRQGRITEGHARGVAAIKNPAAQMALFDEIINNNLSVRQVEGRTREMREVDVREHKRSKILFDPEMRDIAKKLENFLGGRKVLLKKSGIGGTILIGYDNKKDLEDVIKKLIK